MLSWICAVAAGLLTACEPAAASQSETGASRPPPAVVKTVALERAEIAQKIDGVATVLAPDQLIALDAELRNASIALKFSQQQYARFSKTPTLPLLTVENSERQLSTDTSQINLLEARLRNTYGDAAPFLDQDARSRLVGELAAGTRALVRMDFPVHLGSVANPGDLHDIRVAPLSGGSGTAVTTIWSAPSGNQAMPGTSYFGLIDAGPGLRPGDRTRLSAETSQRNGIVIPSASIVVTESRTWCYVETSPQHFERRPVSLSTPVEDGYLVEDGFEAGMKVVVNGASTLLARESEPIMDDDDDDGGARKHRPEAQPAAHGKESDDDDAPHPKPAASSAPPNPAASAAPAVTQPATAQAAAIDKD